MKEVVEDHDITLKLKEIDTIAGHKLMYQETEKPPTQIKLAVCEDGEDGQDRQTKHVQEV